MKYGLKGSTIEKICGVFARYPQVGKAILYGSRAKGNYKHGSDIDLTLYGDADLTRRILYRILDDLDDLLLPYAIDLSLFSSISDPDVVEHIQRVGVIFYERDALRTLDPVRSAKICPTQTSNGPPSPPKRDITPSATTTAVPGTPIPTCT